MSTIWNSTNRREWNRELWAGVKAFGRQTTLIDIHCDNPGDSFATSSCHNDQQKSREETLYKSETEKIDRERKASNVIYNEKQLSLMSVKPIKSTSEAARFWLHSARSRMPMKQQICVSISKLLAVEKKSAVFYSTTITGIKKRSDFVEIDVIMRLRSSSRISVVFCYSPFSLKYSLETNEKE